MDSHVIDTPVNVYGPSDFTKSNGKSVDAAQVLTLWLGGDLDHVRAKHIRPSPLNWVTPNAAPKTRTVLSRPTDFCKGMISATREAAVARFVRWVLGLRDEAVACVLSMLALQSNAREKS